MATSEDELQTAAHHLQLLLLNRPHYRPGVAPEGSRKLRFPDYVTTAQDGGKVVSLTHRPTLPPGNAPESTPGP